jgi:hypothetical protein
MVAAVNNGKGYAGGERQEQSADAPSEPAKCQKGPPLFVMEIRTSINIGVTFAVVQSSGASTRHYH